MTASSLTAVAGRGYFIDTTSNACTVNLPAGSPGSFVAIKDYANKFNTNAVTIDSNGSEKIGGSTDNVILRTQGVAVTIVYADATKGWLVTEDGLQSTLQGLTVSANFLVFAGGASGACRKAGGGGADHS